MLHSEADEVVPFAQAQQALSKLTSCKRKQLKAFKDTGHNNIFSSHLAEYFCLVRAFVHGCLLPPLGDRAELSAMSAKELKGLVMAYGLSSAGLLEKSDFVDRLLQHSADCKAV